MICTSTRPEQRRNDKAVAKEARYDRRIPASNGQTFPAFNSRIVRQGHVRIRPSKYMPHIGAKQRAKAAA